MGCLRNIIKIAVIILAVIGFLSIGGREFMNDHVIPFVKNFIGNFNSERELSGKQINNLTFDELKGISLIAAQKTIEQSTDKHMEGIYEITSVKGVMGYDAEIVQDTKTGQKMVTIDTNNKINLDLSNPNKNELKSDMLKIVKKHKNVPIKIDDIDIVDQGKWLVAGDEQNYVTITVKDKMSGQNIKAIISSADAQNSKMYVTFAPDSEFSAETAKKYWK